MYSQDRAWRIHPFTRFRRHVKLRDCCVCVLLEDERTSCSFFYTFLRCRHLWAFLLTKVLHQSELLFSCFPREDYETVKLLILQHRVGRSPADVIRSHVHDIEEPQHHQLLERVAVRCLEEMDLDSTTGLDPAAIPLVKALTEEESPGTTTTMILESQNSGTGLLLRVETEVRCLLASAEFTWSRSAAAHVPEDITIARLPYNVLQACFFCRSCYIFVDLELQNALLLGPASNPCNPFGWRWRFLVCVAM